MIFESENDLSPQLKDLMRRASPIAQSAMKRFAHDVFSAAQECGVCFPQAAILAGELLTAIGLNLVARPIGVSRPAAKRVANQAVARIESLARVADHNRGTKGGRR